MNKKEKCLDCVFSMQRTELIPSENVTKEVKYCTFLAVSRPEEVANIIECNKYIKEEQPPS